MTSRKPLKSPGRLITAATCSLALLLFLTFVPRCFGSPQPISTELDNDSLRKLIQAATENYSFYLNDFGGRTFIDRTGRIAIDPRKIAEAKTAPECRPASKDPEGNWGIEVNGFLVGIRMAWDTFAADEPVKATLIVRNAGTIPANLCDIGIQRVGAPLDVVVFDSSNRPIKVAEHDPTYASITQGRPRALEPGTQIRFPVTLSKAADLSRPGKYFVYGIARGLKPVNAQDYLEARSGTAVFEVLKPGENPPRSVEPRSITIRDLKLDEPMPGRSASGASNVPFKALSPADRPLPKSEADSGSSPEIRNLPKQDQGRTGENQPGVLGAVDRSLILRIVLIAAAGGLLWLLLRKLQRPSPRR